MEVYPEARKLNQQFKYADRRGVQAVVIAGANEFSSGIVQIKWLADGSQTEIPLTADSKAVADWLIERISD